MFSQAKLIAAGAVFALGLATGWKVTSWHYQAREGRAIEAAAIAERQSLQHVIDSLRDQITAANEASHGYQSELTRLRNGAGFTPVVRVRECPKSTGQLPATSSATSGPDAGTTAGGVVPPAAAGDSGRDIGPELTALVDEADRCSAQLRALQSWARKQALSKPPSPSAAIPAP